MTFEVYIYLSCIWDVQPINVFVMRCPTEPDLKRGLKSRAITELKKREMHRARQQSSGASSVSQQKSHHCFHGLIVRQASKLGHSAELWQCAFRRKWHLYKPLHLSNKMEIFVHLLPHLMLLAGESWYWHRPVKVYIIVQYQISCLNL